MNTFEYTLDAGDRLKSIFRQINRGVNYGRVSWRIHSEHETGEG